MNMQVKNNWLQVLWVGLAMLLFLAQPAGAQSNNYEKKKEISKSFAVASGDRLEVENRYGSINIVHWNREEVALRVVIESSARSEKVMQYNLDRVRLDLHKEGNTVRAITSFLHTNNENNGGNSRFSIDYYIQIPARLEVSLSQKYGNIKLPDTNPGKSTISVKYGDFSGGRFTGALAVECKYGNVRLDQTAVPARLDLAYSNAWLEEGTELEVESRYSNLYFGNIRKLSMEKKYGNLSLKKVEEANLELKYSDVTIDEVTRTLTVEGLKYGTLNLPKLSGTFQRITVDSYYGTCKLRLPASAAFRLEAEGMEYGSYKVKGFRTTRSERPDKESYLTEVNGGGGHLIRYNGNGYGNVEVKVQ